MLSGPAFSPPLAPAAAQPARPPALGPAGLPARSTPPTTPKQPAISIPLPPPRPRIEFNRVSCRGTDEPRPIPTPWAATKNLTRLPPKSGVKPPYSRVFPPVSRCIGSMACPKFRMSSRNSSTDAHPTRKLDSKNRPGGPGGRRAQPKGAKRANLRPALGAPAACPARQTLWRRPIGPRHCRPPPRDPKRPPARQARPKARRSRSRPRSSSSS